MFNKEIKQILSVFIFLSLLIEAKGVPKGFVNVKEEISNIELEMRYYGLDNFMGEPVDGYLAPKAILTISATDALKKVQNELNSFGLGLKIFDTYRPQKAVDHFVRWGKDLNRIEKKEKYFPTVEKKNLFKEGYIAKHSGHSRGSTIDLTIIDLNTKRELDMGSCFDFFGERSWVHYQALSLSQRANRLLLHTIMFKYGFKSYSKEWWHFTLKNEPYKRYFNFDIR